MMMIMMMIIMMIMIISKMVKVIKNKKWKLVVALLELVATAIVVHMTHRAKIWTRALT